MNHEFRENYTPEPHTPTRPTMDDLVCAIGFVLLVAFLVLI